VYVGTYIVGKIGHKRVVWMILAVKEHIGMYICMYVVNLKTVFGVQMKTRFLVFIEIVIYY
jgi:hypothetical protein